MTNVANLSELLANVMPTLPTPYTNNPAPEPAISEIDMTGEEQAMQTLRDWKQERRFRQSGNRLDWYVSKKIAYVDGKPTNFYGIQREDTGHIFQMATDSYEPFQNWELLQLCQIAAEENNITLSNIGYLGEGELVFIQARTGETNIGGSGLEKYITTLNSHDGSTALKWGLSNVNVVCQNTFFAAYRQVQNATKHTVNMRARIAGMVDAFKSAKNAETSLYDSLAKLADTQLTTNAVFSVVETVFDIKKEDIAKAPTRTQNQIKDLKDSISLEIGRQGQNLWGLYNGVTHYTTHKVSKDADQLLKSKMTGQSQRRDNDVLQQLLNLVPIKTTVTI